MKKRKNSVNGYPFLVHKVAMNKIEGPNSRYHRQVMFEPFGATGQERLGRSTVLICGCGALGAGAAQILARAGLKRLILVDSDTVSWSNLHRQFLFTEEDARCERPKTDAARETLLKGNSALQIDTFHVRLTSENAENIIRDVDVIMDATDNFATRFLLNSLALRKGIPLISGGVSGANGQVMTVIPGKTPCLACLMDPKEAQNNETVDFPVLSPVVQVVSAFQAMDAMKILSGNLDMIRSCMTIFDMWGNRIRSFSLETMPVCQCCK